MEIFGAKSTLKNGSLPLVDFHQQMVLKRLSLARPIRFPIFIMGLVRARSRALCAGVCHAVRATDGGASMEDLTDNRGLFLALE